MEALMLTESASSQLQIRFITTQERYAVADTPFAVPAGVTSNELNTLVNELLREQNGSDKRSLDFDFLACGHFLRSALGEHIGAHGVSGEDVIDVEYVERLPAPEPKDCLLHDDWVAAVSVCESWILTGCYDNTVHIWSTKGKHKMTMPGHNGAVKGVAWISVDASTASFVSVSADQTAMLWTWDVVGNTVECIHVCRGHERAVECVSVNGQGNHFATSGWDTMLKIWSTATDGDADRSEVGESLSKRMKREESKSQIKTPVVTLKGHKEAVSGVVYCGNGNDCWDVVTCSWDHMLRLWDIQAATCVQEFAGNKAFFDVDHSVHSRCLLTASADRHVRLYDPRSTEGSVVKTTFTSHSQWVQTVRWSKMDANLFISGGYDNQFKLWDVRSPRVPMFELSGHEDKILCCDWSNPQLMVSGGADNTLRIFKSKNVPASAKSVIDGHAV